MVLSHPDYRTFLKTALSARGTSRESLSLRAFSEKLGISNSYLSEILSGKKTISVELAFKIAIKLEMSETESHYFCLLVQLEQEKDPFFREELSKRLKGLNPERPAFDLSADLVHSISEWYHAAILELTYLPGFVVSPGSVAKALGITKVEAEVAMQRLLRLELLLKDKRGAYRKAHNYIYSEAAIPNSAFKKFHGQLLAKAASALETQRPGERLSATDIFALDSRQLEKIDKLSREFSAAVQACAEKSRVKDSVYALTMHVIRLSDAKEPA